MFLLQQPRYIPIFKFVFEFLDGHPISGQPVAMQVWARDNSLKATVELSVTMPGGYVPKVSTGLRMFDAANTEGPHGTEDYVLLRIKEAYAGLAQQARLNIATQSSTGTESKQWQT